MLQFQAKTINISQISKLLVKYNINASITNSKITLNGDITDDLLKKLISIVDVDCVQNFNDEENSSINDIEPSKNEKQSDSQNGDLSISKPTISTTPKYDLLFPEVKRGEIYLCDFGEHYGCEQGKMRPAIIIQNNSGNKFSPLTIVVPCTTSTQKKDLPVHLKTRFSSSNMIDFSFSRINSRENVIQAEQIRTVDKTRLRKYMGKLTESFMEQIDEKIIISLGLDQNENLFTKKELNIDEHQTSSVDTSETLNNKEKKDEYFLRVELLSFIDINELIKISQSEKTIEEKVKEILILFDFDLDRNGVSYLLKAIVLSTQNSYFNLETLSEQISQTEKINKEEIQRLIVARIKERFRIKKSPTIAFIRLVHDYLVKQEDS